MPQNQNPKPTDRLKTVKDGAEPPKAEANAGSTTDFQKILEDLKASTAESEVASNAENLQQMVTALNTLKEKLPLLAGAALIHTTIQKVKYDSAIKSGFGEDQALALAENFKLSDLKDLDME